MNLVSAAERFYSIDRSALTLDIHRCLHSQDQFSTCEACFGICPASAIQPAKPPAFEPEKCIICLACIPTCPVGAFGADDAVKDLLMCVARIEKSSIELLCALNPNFDQGCDAESIGIHVRGCLAGLGTGAFLSLVAMGLETVHVRMDACADCELGVLKAKLEEQLSEAQVLSEGMNKQNIVLSVTKLENPVQRPVWDAQNPPLSRRDLFRLASRQGQIALGRALEQTQTGSNRSPGRDRRRIINVLSHLPASKFENDPTLDLRTYAILSISDSCTACGVCARACPTSAITYKTDAEETTFQLKITPQLCIGCELCAHACVPNAISINQSPKFHQVFGSETAMLLREGGLAHCEICKAVFVPSPDTYLCPACKFRQDNPFGSRLRPSMGTGAIPSGKGQP